MKQIIEYKTNNGGDVYVEVANVNPKGARSGMNDVGAIRDKADEVIDVVKGSFEKSLANIYSFADAITIKLKDLNPQKIEVEFGIKFSAEAGAIITSVGAEANLKVKLTWDGSNKN